MLRKLIVLILAIAAAFAALPVSAQAADSGNVLLVYNDKEQMSVISDLVKACGMVPVTVESAEYTSSVIKDYDYIVLQDAAPLKDVLQSGKRPVCLGSDFAVIPEVQTNTLSRTAHAELSVYTNTQSVILSQGFSYISEYSGEAVGEISIEGRDYPMGVITDSVIFAPYFNRDDITAFAVAKMLNVYFGKLDGGKMYVMIDNVYPFDDINMLETIADKFYRCGIPFVMSLMPVYYNTDYPSFKRFAEALRYIQSRNGSLVMHSPLVTGNELVGDDINTRMEEAFKSFEDNGVHVYKETIFPYEVSLDMLAGVHPQNELFISLPIDTIIKFDVFQNEVSVDAALDTINSKWMQIGDYRRNFTDNVYLYEKAEIDENYEYKQKSESSYTFLVNAGNQILSVVVLISGVIILALIIIGFRLYRRKFLKKRNK